MLIPHGPLVDVLVGATEDQPGRLPLLQHTLDLLWDARERPQRRLTHAAYHEVVGSLEESVARRAEGVFAALVERCPAREKTIRRLFLRLVHIGEGIGNTRRQMTRDELPDSIDAAMVLDAFIGARLIVTDTHRGKTAIAIEQGVEIVHEALIDRWVRLRKWLIENHEAVRARQSIELAAREWIYQGNPSEDLWSGSRLARVRQILTESALELSQGEREFLETSEHRWRSIQQEARLRRFGRIIGLAGASIAVLSLLATALYLYIDGARLKEDKRKAEITAREDASNVRRHEQTTRVSLLARTPGKELEALSLGVGVIRPDHDSQTTTLVALRGLSEALGRARTIIKLEGHQGRIRALAWADDTRLATASVDGAAFLWNGSTGERIADLPGHGKTIEALAWAAGGELLATASMDGTARIWNGQDGSLVGTLAGHRSGITRLAWSPERSILATGSLDQTVRVWDEFGQELAILAGHHGGINTLSWNSDGTRLASGSFDATAKIWDPQVGREFVTLHGHSRLVEALSWSADGARIATASFDGTVRLWSATTGEQLARLDGHALAVVALAWSRDGTRLATAGIDGSVKLWDANKGSPLYEFDGHEKRIVAMAWGPDDRRLATASADGTARLWDGVFGKPIEILRGHGQPMTTLAWSPDGSVLVTASTDGSVQTWDGGTGEERTQFVGHAQAVRVISWSNSGSRFATGSDDGEIFVWGATTGIQLATLRGDWTRVVAMSGGEDRVQLLTMKNSALTGWDGRFADVPDLRENRFAVSLAVESWASRKQGVTSTPIFENAKLSNILRTRHNDGLLAIDWTLDGSRIAVANAKNLTILTNDFKLVWEQQVSGLDKISSLRWSPDGTRLAIANLNSVQLWSNTTNSISTSLAVPSGAATLLTWAPGSDRLAVVGSSESVTLWNTSDGRRLAELNSHYQAIVAMAWTLDGARLATASRDWTAQIWDGYTGEQLWMLEGHTNEVVDLAWSPDASLLATASKDGTARVWHTKTGEMLTVLNGHKAGVEALAWDASGARLLTASADGSAILWAASPLSWVSRACEVLMTSRSAVGVADGIQPYCASNPVRLEIE